MLPYDLVPSRFHPLLQRQLELWHSRASDEQRQRLHLWAADNPEPAAQLAKVWVCSQYVAQVAMDQVEHFLQWLDRGIYALSLNERDLAQDLDQRLCEKNLRVGAADFLPDDKEFDRQMRRFRRDMMLRIIWRDFCRLAEMMDTTRDMTHLAEVTVQAAIVYHNHQLQSRFGVPIGKYTHTPQPLVVLGMGKLGGYELNVSSDIDLIFTYPEAGETDNASRSISNQEYFVKLGQKIIGSLDTVTGDGFVFRVDMRLRPYGQSGALVLNYDAMEEYYQTQGREWERYAMIKARVVSGNVMPDGLRAGDQLMDLLRPFTYRRYLDFSAIDSMRDMKSLINREVQRKGISTDVKLGAGGIREIEFVVQVFQMIRGGKDARLRERKVLVLLPLLEEEGYLPDGAAAELTAAYVFLRNAEHAIQGYQDKQTQSVPVDEDDRERLAWVMGYESFDDFYHDLSAHRDIVNAHFQHVIAEPESRNDADDSFAAWQSIWLRETGPEGSLPDVESYAQQLAAKGMVEPEQMADALLKFLSSRTLRTMQSDGRVRLDTLMPRLLALLCELQQPAETLSRVLTLVESVARRTAYLLLLVENPNALRQLIRLCGSSSWIAAELANHPALLDELLDQRSLYNPPDKNALRDELRQQVLRISWEDLEGQMETLRYFRMAHGLRVAASEITEALPLMKVSDYLTWLAEVILEHVLSLAWQQMVERHGKPQPLADEPEPDFVVVGYGKLGGIELGHGSDLDLVFIHDANAQGSSDGERALDNQTFFTRLGQKMIHILNTQTVSGKLYEVDMRLRPSGNSGLLVSSLTAFEKYQRNEAWTWEHQALTRARVVAGGARLAAEFERLRDDLLQQPRDDIKLKHDVVEMREKMRSHLGTKGVSEKNQHFNLKQDAGGIVDIEFLVQYLVLARAYQTPELSRWSDNIRILGCLEEAGILSADEAGQLIEAYKAYRAAGHRLTLQRLPSVVQGDEFVQEREMVSRIWERYLGE